MNVVLEPNPARKRELQEHLSAMLPDWFGQPESNAKYAVQAEILDGYIVESEGVPSRHAFAQMAQSRKRGSLLDGRRPGIPSLRSGPGTDGGSNRSRSQTRSEIPFCDDTAPDVRYEPYQRTRRFYEAMGLVYVLEEQFPANPESPTAYYLKQL